MSRAEPHNFRKRNSVPIARFGMPTACAAAAGLVSSQAPLVAKRGNSRVASRAARCSSSCRATRADSALGSNMRALRTARRGARRTASRRRTPAARRQWHPAPAANGTGSAISAASNKPRRRARRTKSAPQIKSGRAPRGPPAPCGPRANAARRWSATIKNGVRGSPRAGFPANRRSGSRHDESLGRTALSQAKGSHAQDASAGIRAAAERPARMIDLALRGGALPRFRSPASGPPSCPDEYGGVETDRPAPRGTQARRPRRLQDPG
jgi:hypothetical protein